MKKMHRRNAQNLAILSGQIPGWEISQTSIHKTSSSLTKRSYYVTLFVLNNGQEIRLVTLCLTTTPENEAFGEIEETRKDVHDSIPAEDVIELLEMI